MRKILIVFLLFITSFSFGQKKYTFELFPSGQNFIPLRANFEEARLGVMVYASNLNLKVDIGNSSDLLKYSWNNGRDVLTADIEFMAYALATSYSQYRLQIDAVDGFFGGGVAFSHKMQGGRFLGRFRIIHNSSHLVDGHYDQRKKMWIDGKKPIPFTRDFGELLLGKEISTSSVDARYYGALAFAKLVRPSLIKRWSASAGVEVAFKNLTGKFFAQPTSPFVALHSTLKGMPAYSLSYNLMAGIKLGRWIGKGVNFYLSYYRGNNFFNEYYSEKIELFSIGFFVDYF